MKKILIVCEGNSCRSQMAEGFLKDFAPGLEIYSAGIEPQKCVNTYAIKAMNESFIDISSSNAKPLDIFLYKKFDFIITFSELSRKKVTELIETDYKLIHIPVNTPVSVFGADEETLEKYREIRNKLKFEMFNFFLEHIGRGS